MSPSFFFRQLLRESRGASRSLALFGACLALGVAAVVSVAALGDSLDQAVRKEAKALLAADLAVEGRRPLPEAVERAAAALPGARLCRLAELTTMSAAASGQPPPSSLVEVKAVEGTYPFYGRLELEPSQPLAELLAGDGVVVAPELLVRLRLSVGDQLRLGNAGFTIRGVVSSEADRLVDAFTMGPRVFVSRAGLDRSALVQVGSRVLYRLLLALPENPTAASVAAARQQLEGALQESPYYRIETYDQAQPALRRSLSRVERFLGLVALLSLLVGGLGVAQGVRAWLASRIDAVAIDKCLGMRPREVLGFYLAQCLALAILASLAGGLVGLLLQSAVPGLLGGIVPPGAIELWQPAALARGVLLGATTALLFALAPLVAVLRVPPARALRHSAEPLPQPRAVAFLCWLALLIGIAGLAMAQAASWQRGLIFTGGLAVALSVMAGAAAAMRRAAAAWRRRVGGAVARYALAALGRPDAGALSTLVALATGVLVILTTWTVEQHLRRQLDDELPREAPSHFLVDVQTDQWPGVVDLLRQGGAEGIDSVPVIMARLRAIDHQTVDELSQQLEGQRRWALTREQRLTTLATLPADNELLAGSLWLDDSHDEVSLEEGFAEGLGVGLGSVLTFDVQGVPIELTVTSLRRVEWRSFRINFFLVVEPGVLDDAPQQILATARLPVATEDEIRDRLVQAVPNVTLVPLRQVLGRIQAIFGRLAVGIRALGGFTVLAGLVVLAGAVVANGAQRAREVALLKTLGATALGVRARFGLEYALVGLLAGCLGTATATLLSQAIVVQVFEIPWSWPVGALIAAPPLTAGLAVVAGLAASSSALARRPIEVLRGLE